nr:MAG TPA: Putative transferase, nesg, ydcK, Structural Genomics.38A [Caudoviricetes sp.]
MKKFELTSEFITNIFGTKLFRIKALIEFGNVKAGELGGFVEKEENLSQDGNAWVYDNARVYGDACVYGDARVCGDACVYGDAGYATVHGFGSEYRTTTFFKTKAGVGVKCGCFYGNLSEFRKKVVETHGETKKAKEYLMLADLMEFRFSDNS